MDNDRKISKQDHLDCVSYDGRPFRIEMCAIISMPRKVRDAYLEKLGYYTTDGIHWFKHPTDD